MSYQPRLPVETLRSLAKDRVVRRISERYQPDKRHANNAAVQAEFLTELTADVVECLPATENAECVGLILDNAWKAIRQERSYSTWPTTREVLDAVRDAVKDFNRKTTARPERPAVVVEKAGTVMSKADHEAWMAKWLERNKDARRTAAEMRSYRSHVGRPHPHEARWFPDGLPEGHDEAVLPYQAAKRGAA
jgi:hypothetical protein